MIAGSSTRRAFDAMDKTHLAVGFQHEPGAVKTHELPVLPYTSLRAEIIFPSCASRLL